VNTATAWTNELVADLEVSRFFQKKERKCILVLWGLTGEPALKSYRWSPTHKSELIKSLHLSTVSEASEQEWTSVMVDLESILNFGMKITVMEVKEYIGIFSLLCYRRISPLNG